MRPASTVDGTGQDSVSCANMSSDGPSSPQQPVTMADIARLAGVAESTVSRALKDSNRVSYDMKKRIRALVDQHGYKVNARARALRTRKTNTIQVAIPSSRGTSHRIANTFLSELSSALTEELSSRGYDMLISKASPWQDVPGADAVAGGRADGIIVLGQSNQPEKLADYAANGAPMVVWGAQIPGQNYVTVGTDNRLGGQLVGEHLAKTGRRRIIFFGDLRHDEVRLRQEGCMTALTQASQEQQTLSVASPFDPESAYNSAINFFGGRGAPWHDAVFAASDVIAMATVQALRDLNVRVPEDVAVVGYDDIMVASCYSPALTTVRQDPELAVKNLVDALVAKMSGEPIRSILLPTKLIVRHSCGMSLTPTA
ncbi:MAG: LacI family DNA-binding transcriptional regulator [Hyphomonadaceae bacterium]|nr:LacI family DNA-binding transcriptional regulator [Hyphomonadaceae bacterium]